MPAQTHRINRAVFDRTEPAYYSGTMTTPRNHIMRRQPLCAKHADCRPRPTVSLHSAPNRSAPQEPMPNSRSAGFDRMRQSPTKHNENSCAPARARQRRSVPPSLGMDCAPGATGWAYRLELPSPSRHANKPNGTKLSTRLTSPNSADIVISTGRYSNIESTPQGWQASETPQLLPRNPV